MEEEKNKGNITLEEYDTLRIRYERKLGNKETVSKLQESKGFKPSAIKEKKARKEELYDEFVDQYSISEGKDYGEIQRSNIFNKSFKRAIIIFFILIAFGVGIMAGLNGVNMQQEQTTPNVTVTDSAFSATPTLTTSNMTVDTSNVSYNYTKKTTKKKKTYSSSKSSTSSSDTSSKQSSESSSDSSESSSSGSHSSSSGSGSSSSSGGSSSSSGSYHSGSNNG